MRARLHNAQQGFTLVEVLVALAILGLVAGGILGLTTQNARLASASETQVLAGMLLDNEMIELLGRTSLLDREDAKENVDFGGRRWTVERNISDSPVQGLARIEITILDGAGKTEANAITVKAEAGAS